VQGKGVKAGVGVTRHGGSVILRGSDDCGLYCRERFRSTR
jgi:hypothetical protein